LDEFNARLHEQIVDRDPEDILRDSQQVFQELIREVETHSEAYLFGTHRVEGVSDNVIPYQMLKSESYGHYRDHIPAIQAWIVSNLQG
jgi:ribonucleotide monophosphatase NagD (HAD superfamily)